MDNISHDMTELHFHQQDKINPPDKTKEGDADREKSFDEIANQKKADEAFAIAPAGDEQDKKGSPSPPPPPVSYTPHEIKAARRLVYKNLLVVGFSWVFLFTAFTGLAFLQSSLNSDGGLGTISLSSLYASLIFSCLVLPSAMIEKLGIKYTLMVSQLSYVLYICANLFPRYYTLVPTAIILGLGAAPLWTAKCTFLTDLSLYYSKYTGETNEVVLNRFFGIFFAMFQSSNIWTNIISSTVLRSSSSSEQESARNVSFCGINDHPDNEYDSAGAHPEQIKVIILCGIYVVCSLLGIALIWTCLDTYEQIGLKRPERPKKSTWQLLINTLKHIRHKNQMLIIPLTMWSGLEQAFISADFTKSFVTCTQGIQYVGIIMICYGVVDAIGSYGFGFLIKYTGRVPIYLLAASLNFTSIGLMYWWVPSESGLLRLFAIALCWALGDAVWQTQINAFYGVLFVNEQEASFSNYRLWESLGFSIAYAYSNFLGVKVKLILLTVYLIIGMTGYGIIEISQRPKKNDQITPF